MSDPKDDDKAKPPVQSPSPQILEQPIDVISALEDEAPEIDTEVDGKIQEVAEPVRIRRPPPPGKKRMVKPSTKTVKLEVVRAVSLCSGKILTPGHELNIAEYLAGKPAIEQQLGHIVTEGHVIEVTEDVAEDLCQKYRGPYAYFGQRAGGVKRYEIVRCRPYVGRAKRSA